jgi:hypothetical protein
MAHLEWRGASTRVPKTVMNVGIMECRWVTSRKTPDGFRVFCGKPALKALKPYCEHHYGMVYNKARSLDDFKV